MDRSLGGLWHWSGHRHGMGGSLRDSLRSGLWAGPRRRPGILVGTVRNRLFPEAWRTGRGDGVNDLSPARGPLACRSDECHSDLIEAAPDDPAVGLEPIDFDQKLEGVGHRVAGGLEPRTALAHVTHTARQGGMPVVEGNDPRLELLAPDKASSLGLVLEFHNGAVQKSATCRKEARPYQMAVKIPPGP